MARTGTAIRPEDVRAWGQQLDAVARRIGERFARGETRDRVRSYLLGLLAPVRRAGGPGTDRRIPTEQARRPRRAGRIVAGEMTRDETEAVVRRKDGKPEGRGGAKRKPTPPRPRTIRTADGKVTVEPRKGAGADAIRADLTIIDGEVTGKGEAAREGTSRLGGVGEPGIGRLVAGGGPTMTRMPVRRHEIHLRGVQLLERRNPVGQRVAPRPRSHATSASTP